jgi:hypothetical protein
MRILNNMKDLAGGASKQSNSRQTIMWCTHAVEQPRRCIAPEMTGRYDPMLPQAHATSAAEFPLSAASSAR